MEKDKCFPETVSRLKGGISDREALYLRDVASKAGYGWILEVGSYRGKSAVSLYEGARSRRHRVSPDVYCIEPHAEFLGVYGGKFGPADRAEFYRVMVETGARTVEFH